MDKDGRNMAMIAIAAMAQNRIIGNNNTLLWRYPEDLQRFKKLTSWHTVIMGRKTFESIGKPLPHRDNIVLTRNAKWKASGVTVLHTVETLLDRQKLWAPWSKTYVIGGEQIYKELLSYCDSVELTLIKKVYQGDASFPSFEKDFHETTRERHPDYDFITYTRNTTIL